MKRVFNDSFDAQPPHGCLWWIGLFVRRFNLTHMFFLFPVGLVFLDRESIHQLAVYMRAAVSIIIVIYICTNGNKFFSYTPASAFSLQMNKRCRIKFSYEKLRWKDIREQLFEKGRKKNLLIFFFFSTQRCRVYWSNSDLVNSQAFPLLVLTACVTGKIYRLKEKRPPFRNFDQWPTRKGGLKLAPHW